jgi:hypothetical protein
MMPAEAQSKPNRNLNTPLCCKFRTRINPLVYSKHNLEPPLNKPSTRVTSAGGKQADKTAEMLRADLA